METDKNAKKRDLGVYHEIKGEIANHRALGTPTNIFILRFPEPRNMLSSRQGFREISAICNCYIPKPIQELLHDRPQDWDAYSKEVLSTVDLPPDGAATLSTGVSMEHLAWKEESYGKLWVLAFVTAGVNTNAMRVGKDEASTIESDGVADKIGTINTILLTGASLDLAAMAGSFITITEAKNIALQEMDVRSSYNPDWQATGTGTDQIITVSGKGSRCTYVGGHSKLGELMAQAVTSATINAIKKRLKASD